jgi:mRNA interferase RelE/StbE
MKILIDKSFAKDVRSIGNQKILNDLADYLEKLKVVKKLSDIPNCKKLKGSKNAYRIKIADFRIGFVFENETIELIRFLPRSKIYSFFPS